MFGLWGFGSIQLLDMIADCSGLRVRLVASLGCCLALGFLYIRALAGAYAYGTYDELVHPWRSVPLDILLLTLSITLILILSVFMRLGSRPQRLCAIGLAVLPVGILVHFTRWLISMYES